MKTFCLFVLRIILCALFEWFTYYTSPAQGSISLGAQSRVTLAPKTKVICTSTHWLGDAEIYLQDSSSWCVLKSITGFDSVRRFFVLGKNAVLVRKVDTLGPYVYPIGYGRGLQNYRGFAFDMKSLGQTGTGTISATLIPQIYGAMNYEKYFPVDDSSCLAGSSINFNCLSQDGWHCDGPNDYEYSVSAFSPDYCAGSMRRVIKTATNSNAWEDSIENVIGNLGQSFCEYSQLTGGQYKDFSDFAITSNTFLLPVTLINLQADPIDNSFIRISWKTELEINNEKFLITRSVDGQSFTRIGELTGQGNSTKEQGYVFDDTNALANIDYYYRLEQVDYDGVIHLSPMVHASLIGDRVLYSRTFNILGQEVPLETKGMVLKQVLTVKGSKIFKTVVE